MRLVLVLVLILVGILEIPLTNDFKTTPLVSGEVKGKEIGGRKFFSPAAISSAPPSPSPSPFPSPSLLPSPTPTPSSFPHPSPRIIQEIILLAAEKRLQDQKLELVFPELNHTQEWFLEIEFELVSKEDTLGFDDPGLTIHLDGHLAYRQSAFESGIKKVSFKPRFFSDQPQTLTVWSGNSGDGLKETYTIIKNIKLITQNKRHFTETEPISDLVVTVDSEDFLTLEWTSPQSNDSNLNKTLAYQIRYSSASITTLNWSQAQLGEIFLPSNFSPQSPTTKELALIKAPLIDVGYLAIRSLDSTGSFSPLGDNVPFLLR